MYFYWRLQIRAPIESDFSCMAVYLSICLSVIFTVTALSLVVVCLLVPEATADSLSSTVLTVTASPV